MTTTISFPKICGVYSFEKLLLDLHKRKLLEGSGPVTFDLSETAWIGSLEASLLYDLVAQVAEQHRDATVRIENATDTTVADYFSRTGLSRELESLGAKVKGRHATGVPSKIGAFKRFGTRAELLAYDDAVANPETRARLLGGGDDCSLIATGEFREIVLRELGENSFTHGGGSLVRYFVSENAGRRTADPFSYPQEMGHIEVVVSDSGVGLVTRLRTAVDPDWEPPHSDTRLSVGARTCAFALEFSATSDPASRRERLLSQLNSTEDFSEVVPTGLFYVASLVRHYQGQLLIRTGRTCFLLDCTVPGQATIRENPLQIQGGKVRGTHVVVRVPRNASKRNIQSPRRVIAFNHESRISLDAKSILLSELWQAAKLEPADFLVRVEKAVETVFSSKHSSNSSALILLANGFQPDTKTAAWILTWLGAIPRRSMDLAVCGLDTELFEAAREQSRRIAGIRSSANPGAANRFQTWQPYEICCEETDAMLSFGEGDQVQPRSPVVDKMYRNAARDVLRKIISAPPVKHIEKPGRYYLIEGNYYTQRFYEVRQLTSRNRNPVGARLVATYLKMHVQKNNVGMLYCLSESLNDVVEEVGRLTPEVTCYLAGAEETSFLRAMTASPTRPRVLLLTDVICTGNQFQPLLKRAPRIEDIEIFALVDARETPNKIYIVTERPERAHSVPVHSLLETTIRAIYDLPQTIDADILVIDRDTHAPTPKDALQHITIPPEEAIAESSAADALYQGHVVVDDVHYVDFVVLPRLLTALQTKLTTSWSHMLQVIEGNGIDRRQLSVFYLSEGRGWERMVDDYMSTRGVAECRSIDRARLGAPPANLETSIRGSAVMLILPVIASGETLRRCLEYFSRLRSVAAGRSEPKAPPIFVCVALGRASSSELSFYQGIRSFKDSRIHIEVMSYLPLPAYRGKNACPVCQLIQTVRANSTRLRGQHSAALVDQASATLRQVDIVFEDGNPKLSGNLGPSCPTRAILRSLYNEAERDINRRRALAEKLDRDENKQLFIEMVGSHADLSAFAEEHLKQRLYSRFDALRDYARQSITRANERPLSLVTLIGLHILFPSELENGLKWLAFGTAKREDKSALADLLFVTMTDPTLYGRPFSIGIMAARYSGAKMPADQAEELAANEIWSDPLDAKGVDCLGMVLWLLRRSTDWGTRIETLRASLYSDQPRSLVEKFRDFEYKGVNVILRNMAMIDAADRGNGLLTAIRAEGCDPTTPTTEILELTGLLRALLAREVPVIGEVGSTLEKLDQAGKNLLESWDRIFTNPHTAVQQLREALADQKLLPALSPDVFEIRSSIADDQPGILFALQDLVASLLVIIENAANHISTYGAPISGAERLWVEFRFAGYDHVSRRAVLEVRDNIPYKRALIPAGGLKQVQAHCTKYGAAVDFNPDQDDNSLVCMRFFFRIDSSRRTP